MTKENNFFQLLGFDESSAKLLSLVISKPNLGAEKLFSELKVSKDRFDSIIHKLTEKKVLEVGTDAAITISPNFAIRTARELETSVEKFADKLRATRFFIAGEFVDEVEKIFQGAGYGIKKVIVDRSKVRRMHPFRELEFDYSFVAEKFYRFGVMVLNQEQVVRLKREVPDPREYRFGIFSERIIGSMQEAANCIGNFVLFSPELEDKVIDEIRRFFSPSEERDRFRGSEFLFVYQPGETIKDFIGKNLNEVEARRDTVEEHFREVRGELSDTHDIVVEDSMLITQLNSLISGRYLPGKRHTTPRFPEFTATIKNVVDREARNLNIFERKYEEEKASIERAMDNFDKRVALPNPVDLKEGTQRIRRLKSKFEPIRHELRYLQELMFLPYVKGVEAMKINPFLLTEPNNIEIFVVNQDKLKNSASEFLHHLISGGSNVLFIAGAAGTGKTHALRHVFLSRAKELNIWAVYVDCPMKYDIVSSLFSEIVQERNFPKETHHLLPSLRKRRVSTDLEFTEVMRELYNIIRSNGYKGFLLIVDELENALPYTYDYRYQRGFERKEEGPLALRQLKGILSSDLSKDIGFAFAFRDHIISEVKANIEIKNFDSLVVSPARLDIKHFKELIKLRYETWKSPRIEFQAEVIKKVTSITDANTRHTIQYFRALYNQVTAKSKKMVTLKTLDEIGELPLFVY